VILVEPDEAREAADEILSRPEYQEAEPSILQRAFDWIAHLLGDLFGFVTGGGGGLWIGYLILAAALAAAAYLAWRFLPRRHPLHRPVWAAVEQETTVRRSRADWLDEAAEAERAARWDRAVHARYHALVTGLADGGELPSELSTTSGEHRRAFARSPSGGVGERLERFDRATDRYEQIWFGGARAGRSDSEALAEADRSLLGAAG
jgi:hypothetical protein